jgi:hypothetical protein
MKTERYISVLVVMVVGLFLVNTSWPETTFAQSQALNVPTCVQCYAPVNTWSVPATSGAGTPGTVCTTYVPPTTAPACPAVAPAATPWGVLGSILRAPFVIGQCLFGACPQPPC